MAMEDVYQPPKHFSFTGLVKWEENNLTEMMLLRNKSNISIGRIHYLKKEFVILFSIPNANIVEAKWSQQGKYLIVNEADVIYI